MIHRSTIILLLMDFGLYHWDNELKQESRILLSNTLADILLRENLRLRGDVTVVSLRTDS